MPAGTITSFSPDSYKVTSIIQFDFNVDGENYTIISFSKTITFIF